MKKIKNIFLFLLLGSLSISACQPNLALFGLEPLEEDSSINDDDDYFDDDDDYFDDDDDYDDSSDVYEDLSSEQYQSSSNDVRENSSDTVYSSENYSSYGISSENSVTGDSSYSSDNSITGNSSINSSSQQSSSQSSSEQQSSAQSSSSQQSSSQSSSEITPERRTYTYKGESALNHLGKETGTIEFQTGGSSAEKVLWDALLNDFMSKNPGITVKQVNIDKDETLQANLTAGTAPDVIQVQSGVFGSWAQKGWFQSIQPFVNGDVEGIDALNVNDYYPQTVQMFKLNTTTGVRGNGDMFGLPKDFGVIGVFVNREMVVDRYNRGAFSYYAEGASDYAKLMAQKQLTYDEYFRIAHHLTLNCHVDSNGKHDHSGGYWENNVYGANRIHWESFLWGYNVDILTSDYKLNVDNDYVKYVFDQCRNQVTPGTTTFYSLYSDSGATDSGTAFTGRRIIMYMGGRWNASTFDSSFKISPYGSSQGYFCIPVPVWQVKNEKAVIAPTGACSTVCYAISKNCKNTKMAYKLIRYLASRDGYRIMNKMNYAVPGIKDLKEEAKFKDPKTNNSPYDGGFGNVTCNLDQRSAETFFEMADHARISNACRFTTSNWITTFETGLNSFLQDTSKTKYKTSADFLNSVKKSVNSAIKKSDPQLFW